MAQGVRTPLAERSDDQLGALAAQGDEQAFAELYQRYFRGLYDFTLRTLRDRDAASDVVQSTFVKAWAALRSPKGVENVKAWLYAVARNLAIDELRRRQRMAPRSGESEEDPIYTIVDESRLSDPSVAVHDQELVDLVWESAAALSASEYSLLDMHLRQGLDADEISEALGVAKGAVYTRLTRLRDSLDEAVTSSVLMKQARQRCEELDELLTRMNATELTREVKKAITEHAKDCEICGEVKRRLITPAELFAGLTLVPIPAGLMEAIWHGISTELGFAGAAAAGHASGHATATHAAKSSRHATKVKAATALGTLGAVAIIGALLFPRDGAVKDPSDVHSTTHRPGVEAVSPVVRMAWTPRKGADAYSVSWTNGGAAEPDAVGDLPGSAGGATSPALGPGSWWFNLRTKDHGDWTHTVHVGPFIIVGSTIQAALIPTSAYTAVSENGAGTGAGGGNGSGGNANQTPLQQAAQTIVTSPLGGSGSTGSDSGSGSGSTAGGVAGAEHSGTPGDGGTPTPAAPAGGNGGGTTTTTTPTTTTPAPPDEPTTPGTPEPTTPTTSTTTTTTTTPTTTTPTTTAPSQPTDKPVPPDPSIPPDAIEIEGGIGTTTVPDQGPFGEG